MTAADLKRLYVAELRQEHSVNVRLSVDARMGLWGLLSASRRMAPGELREDDHPRVWVSDLHLGHANTIRVFGRPHRTTEEMDDALFGAWRRVVDPGDTIVNLGDLTPAGFSKRRLEQLTRAPGRKVLVLGNHEFRAGSPVCWLTPSTRSTARCRGSGRGARGA